jgi:uncharacterized protein YbaP (TraB family)
MTIHPAIRLLRALAASVPLIMTVSADVAAPPDKPLLWKIEGHSLEKPSYLFGTIHLVTPRIERLHPAAERALDAADTVVTELSFDPMKQMAGAMLMMRGDGSTLSESIGADLHGKLEERIQAINPALGAAVFEPMKTWAVAMAVVMLPHQLDGGKALDQILWQRAADAGKETLGLETMKDQVAAFEVLDEEEQTIYLRATLEHFEENNRLLKEMIAEYEAGDAEAIDRITTQSIERFAGGEREKAIGDKLLKSLITDRDRTMAEAIDAMLREDPAKSRFVAVGAGHLVAENSIRKHLKDKGWKITRITD